MSDPTFDMIVVGAGSAGCVLANRLTRDSSRRVLLLEAGGQDWDPRISIPIGMGRLYRRALYQWGDVSEPEPHLAGRRMNVAHGKVLGGSSSINFMAYTRGHPADYDRWASEGAIGWSYADVLPYFRQCETWEGGSDGWRGGEGELGTQWARTNDPIYESWIQAGQAIGHPFTPDYNGARPGGFGRGQYTIRDGRRSSTTRAFLRPVLARENLTIIGNATALRIVFEGRKAVGVEYLHRGRRRVAGADEEVILSLGSINTPHLMMLSGVGPQDHLRKFGINAVVDLPVGRNLQDHIGISINWRRKSPGQFHRSLRFDRAALSMVRAYMFGSGPATAVPGGLHAFIKTRPELDQHDIEFMFHTVPPEADVWFPGVKAAYADGYGIRPALMRPRSRGEVLLRSADPLERPRIIYNALFDEDDLTTLREGFKQAWAVGHASAMDRYRGELIEPQTTLKTDTEIDHFIRTTATALYHPAGACKMGNDDQAVLDPTLKVRGLDALRVVDASVMPNLVSAHPNAAIIMIAAKAADIILQRSDAPAPQAARAQGGEA